MLLVINGNETGGQPIEFLLSFITPIYNQNSLTCYRLTSDNRPNKVVSVNEDSSDERPPMAVAMEWSARLTVIGLEMALPAAGGYWLDTRWGTPPIFVVAGAVLGLLVSMLHLFQILKSNETKS